jgi:transposase
VHWVLQSFIKEFEGSYQRLNRANKLVVRQRKFCHPHAYDAAYYAQRHLVKRLFSHLNQYRRLRLLAPQLGSYLSNPVSDYSSLKMLS